ncbi:MAG: hypothetical protein IH587_10145 [Anaerolineae bacterium]|nr:hypothetical protein [Anaerolineae bacterium]
MCRFLPWVDLPAEAQAAWVQAIGSILAILVAILIASWQQWSALRQRQKAALMRARALYLIFASDLRDLEGRLDPFLQMYESHPTVAGSKEIRRAISLGSTLGSHSGVSDELADAAEPLQRMLGRMGEIRHIIRQRDESLLSDSEADREISWRMLEARNDLGVVLRAGSEMLARRT